MKTRPRQWVLAATCLLSACAAAPDTSSHHPHRGGAGAMAGSSATGATANDLRNTPALSSTATLPRLHGNTDATGSSRRIDALMSPEATLAPATPTSSGAHPLVGVVPGAPFP